MNARLLLLILIGLCISGCSQPRTASHAQGVDEHGHGGEQSVSLTQQQEAIAGIEVIAAEFREVQETLEVPGTISSTTHGRAVVTPPVSGRLVQFSVQIGDEVKRGQTIGRIESSELADAWARITTAEQDRERMVSSLKDANSQSELAKARVQSAEQTLNRQRELAKAGAFSTSALQQAQRELNDAQSDLLAAQKELATHQENLRRLENLFKEGLVSKTDLQEAQLDVQKDEIEVSRAEAAVRSAKTTYDREKAISEKGLLNSREIQTAEAEVRAAKLEYERSRAAVQSAQAAVRSSDKAVLNARSTYRAYTGGASARGGQVSLIAPLSGTITHLDVTRGQAIDRTQTVCEIENLNSVWVTANVPERDAGKLKEGQDVTVVATAFTDFEFGGFVQVVGSQVDPKSRSIPVRCLVSNSGNRLKSDMFATVRIGVGARVRVLAVPESAVVRDGDETFVFIQSKEGFARIVVLLGRSSGGYTEIQSGLEAGQIVAVEGGFILKSHLAKDELKGHDH